jgi:hypothetical protein
MSFRTAGHPVFPTDKEERTWYNHQGGYIVKTTFHPAQAQYSTTIVPYNLPAFMKEHAPATPYNVSNSESLAVIGGNGLYNGHDDAIRSINAYHAEHCENCCSNQATQWM